MEKSCGRSARVASIGRSEPAPQSQRTSLTPSVYRKHKHSNKPFPYFELLILIISHYSLVNKAIMSCPSRTQAHISFQTNDRRYPPSFAKYLSDYMYT
jgi:hypothetical protein